MQQTAIFHSRKNDNFHLKIVDYFLIFAQNIDCGFTLEPPQWLNEAVLTSTTFYVWEQKYENNVYLCKPQFYNIKVCVCVCVWGGYIARTCSHDVYSVSVSVKSMGLLAA